MGSKKNVDMSATEVEVKKVEAPETEAEKAENQKDDKASEDKAVEEKKVAKKPVQKKIRSKKYIAVKSKVDKTKEYDLRSAIELIKKLSYSKFDGTIVADLIVKKEGTNVELTLPHSTGQAKKVVVVDDKVLANIEAGKIDFDILISTPEYMPKLAKHARVLGPKGLMPNPKSGTLTPNPKQAMKELAAGKMMVKGERKQPLIHIIIGKTNMEDEQLVENAQAIIKVLGIGLIKMSLNASMSPSVKVKLD